jgi:uncharacterized protein (DUF1800 family)
MEPSGLSQPFSRRTLLLSMLAGPLLAAACSSSSPFADAPIAAIDPNPAIPRGGNPTGMPVTTIPGSTTTTAAVQHPVGADHLLRRATFGVTPSARARVAQLGVEGWLDEQLDPTSIDDAAMDETLVTLPTIGLTAQELRDSYRQQRGLIIGELTLSKITRAILSERQLYEVMVGFWSDHFNIDAGANNLTFLKGTDERTVIRPYALGSFSDLLLASAKSPAMLIYLDNVESRADGRNIPNENYARELLELHTVGVDGGYDEEDVVEVAHVLSGWTVSRRTAEMTFNPTWHSMDGVTDVLGWQPGSASGMAAGESLLDHIARLPQTAEFICTKLCRRFVADDPPASLVEGAAKAFLDNDTQIAPVLRTILLSDELASANLAKTKRPFEMLASASRSLNLEFVDLTDERTRQFVPTVLRILGEPVYNWPSPDGPPDIGEPWVNAGSMLQRWNTILTLVNERAPFFTIDVDSHGVASDEDRTIAESLARLANNLGVAIDDLTIETCATALSERPDSGVRAFSSDELRDVAALILISPGAQRR